LIQASLPDFIERIVSDFRELGKVVVTTGAENRAQELYRNVLGAEVVGTLPELYSGDEVVMYASREQLEERSLLHQI
tara:strand:- start:3906 stop:4136 length:231 start_codon:yes stop_codon:yes gene_type:complete